jgi:RimJ/RimL family protein N-acetyltransferase
MHLANAIVQRNIFVMNPEQNKRMLTTTVMVQKLAAFQRAKIARHLQRLSPEDRRLRFGTYMSDAAIEHYVKHIDFGRDKVFGIFDSNLALSGVAHLALEETNNMAELGLSVDPGHRGKGYGFALLNRGKLHAQNLGYKKLYMHCLSENQIMIHLARKAGMQIVAEQGEADAHIELSAASYGDLTRELMGDQVALIDYLFKQQTRWLPRISS